MLDSAREEEEFEVDRNYVSSFSHRYVILTKQPEELKAEVQEIIDEP
jgi:hypothetical protein